MNIILDKEFQSFILPISKSEFEQLKASILKEGCRDSLIIWKDKKILLDGHNRYKICTENNIEFKIHEIKFESRSEAKVWVVINQFSRRNLSKYKRSVLALRLWDIYSDKAKGQQIRKSKSVSPISAEQKIDTREEIAQLAGVAHDTISKVKFIEDHATNEIKKKLLDEEISINQGYSRAKRAETSKAVDAPPFPTGKFRVIYADPPWKYGNKMPEDYVTEQADHYPLMSIEEIVSLPVEEIAEDNAVLFLWVTSPILEESFQIVNAWGFKYKASFVWDKVKHNMGHYNSVRHEFLLLCVKGSCMPDTKKLFDSVVSIERPKKHSEKPEYFREIIDTLYPNGKRVELFATKRTQGWAVYGNELSDL